MRKMFLIVLSLVIVSMFIVGCGTGQAVKFKTPALTNLPDLRVIMSAESQFTSEPYQTFVNKSGYYVNLTFFGVVNAGNGDATSFKTRFTTPVGLYFKELPGLSKGEKYHFAGGKSVTYLCTVNHNVWVTVDSSDDIGEAIETNNHYKLAVNCKQN